MAARPGRSGRCWKWWTRILNAPNIRKLIAVVDPDPDRAHRYARSAVMCMSTVPWHAPLKISVCMVPENDPSGWGV